MLLLRLVLLPNARARWSCDRLISVVRSFVKTCSVFLDLREEPCLLLDVEDAPFFLDEDDGMV